MPTPLVVSGATGAKIPGCITRPLRHRVYHVMSVFFNLRQWKSIKWSVNHARKVHMEQTLRLCVLVFKTRVVCAQQGTTTQTKVKLLAKSAILGGLTMVQHQIGMRMMSCLIALFAELALLVS